MGILFIKLGGRPNKTESKLIKRQNFIEQDQDRRGNKRGSPTK